MPVAGMGTCEQGLTIALTGADAPPAKAVAQADPCASRAVTEHGETARQPPAGPAPTDSTRAGLAARHRDYLSRSHFGSLDGLRFICITAVIWHHMPVQPAISARHLLASRGHTGVDFFFVLSGFLITTLLLREAAAKGRFSLRGFYWRRALRILPIYLLVDGLATVYAVVLRGETEALGLVPYYLLFLSNFLAVEDIGFLSPTWSLAMEEQYYLIWPLLLTLLPRRLVVPGLVTLIAVNVAGVLGVFRAIGIVPVEVGPLRLALGGTTYAPILMGSLAAVLLHRPRGFAAITPWLSFKAAPWLCLAALIATLALAPPTLEGWPNLMVHSLMVLTLVSLVLREDNGMSGVLQFAPIRRIGQVSYGVYLYHLFALALMMKLSEVLGISAWGWLMVSYYALAVGMAELSFRLFESRFQALRHRGWGRPRPPPLPRPPAG